MGMTKKNPRPPGQRYAEAHRPIIPDRIRLPDGREIAVADIVRRIEDRKNYNLREQRVRSTRSGRSRTYTRSERDWLATAPIDQIALAYGLDLTRAYRLQTHSRHVIRLLDSRGTQE